MCACVCVYVCVCVCACVCVCECACVILCVTYHTDLGAQQSAELVERNPQDMQFVVHSSAGTDFGIGFC